MTLLRQFSERLSALEELKQPRLPPVEKWNPALSGSMDLRIDANGQWFHEGTLIQRQELVNLFASILKKEDDNYFLVTPVEKWRIEVEDVPLLVVDYSVKKLGDSQQIYFATSTNDTVLLADKNPLTIRNEKPYLLVRNNLEALIHRNVFYNLVNFAMQKNSTGDKLWLESSGSRFTLS